MKTVAMLVFGLVMGTMIVIDLITRVTSSNLGTFRRDHEPVEYWLSIALQVSFCSAMVLVACIAEFAASQH